MTEQGLPDTTTLDVYGHLFPHGSDHRPRQGITTVAGVNDVWNS